MSHDEPLTEEALRPLLDGCSLGSAIIAYECVGSTNDVALDLAAHGRGVDGALIVAEHQTRGRGRFGRSWHSAPRENLLFSLLLAPRARIARPALLTLATAVAVCRAVESATSARPAIKWPNDITVEEMKVGGILIEAARPESGRGCWVAGVGINVNAAQSDLPEELRATATSLAYASGGPVSRTGLLASILKSFEPLYWKLQEGEHEALIAEASRRTTTLGTLVRVRSGDAVIDGVASGLDDDGALLVRTPVGKTYRLTARDSTLMDPTPSGSAPPQLAQ
ncbi:biotin--[acetyl-CoA-carboxylase] ligase [Candidatus Poribacteria bacterium]|nr:biotin--[acetyl-CoA-carboxylase] ligase [Candidatus Poribacteria bacterium]